jgi:hypothetical protein
MVKVVWVEMASVVVAILRELNWVPFSETEQLFTLLAYHATVELPPGWTRVGLALMLTLGVVTVTGGK